MRPFRPVRCGRPWRALAGAALAVSLLAPPALSEPLALALPGAGKLTAERRESHDSYPLPVSSWHDGRVETVRAEGPVTVKAWRLPSATMTTLQILEPLRAQLVAAGFSILFECADRECGGFDFRFHAEILPEPDMHVDLGDFRYLAARRDTPQGSEHVALVVSRSNEYGFIQLARVGGAPEAPVVTAATKSPDPAALAAGGAAARLPEPGAQGDRHGDVGAGVIERLAAEGRATLEDLRFASGARSLAGDRFASLEALAAYLRADPARRVVIVGHTDAEGSLQGNIALSRARAEAVVDLLVRAHGVSPEQLSAEGVGFLAPRASNDTPEGRALNRRVEVVVQAGG